MGWPDLYKSYVFCELEKVHYLHLLSQPEELSGV